MHTFSTKVPFHLQKSSWHKETSSPIWHKTFKLDLNVPMCSSHSYHSRHKLLFCIRKVGPSITQAEDEKKEKKDYFKDYSCLNLVTKQTSCINPAQKKVPYQDINQSLRHSVGTDERTGLQTQFVEQRRVKLANVVFFLFFFYLFGKQHYLNSRKQDKNAAQLKQSF